MHDDLPDRSVHDETENVSSPCLNWYQHVYSCYPLLMSLKQDNCYSNRKLFTLGLELIYYDPQYSPQE